jgi:membrane protease YdiL (CAAX protease family)
MLMNVPPASTGMERMVAAVVMAIIAIALLALGAYLAFRPRRRPPPALDAEGELAVEPLVEPARAPWGVGEVLGVFLLGLVPAALLQYAAISHDQIVRPNLIPIAIAYQSLAWAALAILVLQLRGERPGRMGWHAPRPGATALNGLLGIAALFAVMIAAAAVMVGALSLFMSVEKAIAMLAHEEGLQQALMPTGPLTAGSVATLAIYILLAPIGEETLFRGMLYTTLRDRFGFLAAAVASSVCFALLHLLPLHLLALFGVGFVLTLLRERTDSLLASIIAHTGLNATAILVWRLHVELPFSQ